MVMSAQVGGTVEGGRRGAVDGVERVRVDGRPAADVAHLVDEAEVGDEEDAELEKHGDDADEDRHDERKLDEGLSVPSASHGGRILVTLFGPRRGDSSRPEGLKVPTSRRFGVRHAELLRGQRGDAFDAGGVDHQEARDPQEDPRRVVPDDASAASAYSSSRRWSSRLAQRLATRAARPSGSSSGWSPALPAATASARTASSAARRRAAPAPS